MQSWWDPPPNSQDWNSKAVRRSSWEKAGRFKRSSSSHISASELIAQQGRQTVFSPAKSGRRSSQRHPGLLEHEDSVGSWSDPSWYSALWVSSSNPAVHRAVHIWILTSSLKSFIGNAIKSRLIFFSLKIRQLKVILWNLLFQVVALLQNSHPMVLLAAIPRDALWFGLRGCVAWSQPRCPAHHWALGFFSTRPPCGAARYQHVATAHPAALTIPVALLCTVKIILMGESWALT